MITKKLRLYEEEIQNEKNSMVHGTVYLATQRLRRSKANRRAHRNTVCQHPRGRAGAGFTEYREHHG